MERGDKNMIDALRQSMDIELKENISREELRTNLANHINTLITADFHNLVSLLYRLDIDEAKLKSMLQDNAGADAGFILADLIIERQLQKMKSREQFRQAGENSIDENEKW